MVITFDAKLEAALNDLARQQGIAPEALASNILRKYIRANTVPEPRDEWERGLLDAARDYGVSLPDGAVSSEGIYD